MHTLQGYAYSRTVAIACLLAGCMFFLIGCHDDVEVRYQSRIVDIHSGPYAHSAVLEVHIEERRSYSRSGRLLSTRTSVSVTNVSSYELDVIVDLHGYDWSETLDIDRWYAWETINLGVVSYSRYAYDYPLDVELWYLTGCGCWYAF
ncbi:MAG: hypothetical protein EA401_12240 [Planctomycetota bacterium]|nr:MAG: hypothetical protein EA401_12240 [Planctomycetota bacterium]